MFYGYNSHYGWNNISHDILIQLAKTKVIEASINENREAILNEAGYMIQSNDS